MKREEATTFRRMETRRQQRRLRWFKTNRFRSRTERLHWPHFGWIIFVAFSLFFGLISAVRGEFGKPLIRNYNPRDLGAEVQNWDVVQDERGIMYFANNGGVLEYDGSTWRLIELPSNVQVRSIAIDSALSRRIYVGANGDFGYLHPDSAGRLQFRSLLPAQASQDPSFDQIFRVVVTPDGALFSGQKQTVPVV